MLREARVSWMTVQLNPAIFKMASLDRKSTRKFYSLGMCSTSKERKHKDRYLTFYKYFIICGSLAKYCLETWLATSWKSILVFSLEAHISKVRIIPVMSTSYSTWLLLARTRTLVYSRSISPGPSRNIMVPLLFTLEDPSMNNTHSEGVSSSIGELSSATKSSMAWDLILPLWTYRMSYSENSTTHDTIFSSILGFFRR